jgi:methanogenic corrinoid protein MtbC1
VARHEEADRSLAERYGVYWRRNWVADVENRVRHLAQAIAVRRPEIVIHTVTWSGSAFAAREVGNQDLATNLRCLREVLQSELPGDAGRQAADYVERALQELSEAAATSNGQIEVAPEYRKLTLEYMEAVLSGRRTDAVALILAAADGGTPVPDLFMGVLCVAQVEIGRMWHRAEITVADEHFATTTTEHIMSVLRQRITPAQKKDRRVIATAVSGDLHALGVRMVAEFFEMDGWDVMYLGANTPGPDIVRALSDHTADLLAVSATSFLNLRQVGELIDAVRSDPGLAGVRIIVGGAPFNLVPDLWDELGADASAASAPDAVETANRLFDS